MRRQSRPILFLILMLSLILRDTARAQRLVRPSADTLRARLFALADDSMGGRDTGSPGNVKAADWVASFFQRYGLEPAGENGTWFQTLPFWRIRPDTASHIEIVRTVLSMGRDMVPVGPPAAWTADGHQAVFGGTIGDTATYPAAGLAQGKLVVLMPRPGTDWRANFGLMAAARRSPRFAGNAGIAVAVFDDIGPDLIDQFLQGRTTTDTSTFPGLPVTLVITRAAARALIAGDPATTPAGQLGPLLIGTIAYARGPIAYPARNVIGILRGTDAALSRTYVSVSGHNDHVGTGRPVDHDSVRAFNRVVRPMGADSRMRPASPEELTRIQAIRDSLRREHPPRLDSIFNGADDDGTGTVALTELARVLSQGPRPKRSILFVNHAAEERGLLGSLWYTDHPTVPRDSIVAEIDVDMIGRGGASDLPNGGPGYIEVVGLKRLSTELGRIVEDVANHEPTTLRFNYEYDAPGHPLQYYCRADHYSYARYGIPSVSFSTGEHLDYHQVTDEPQYIDYDQLARVTMLAQDVLLAVANLDHRPVVDGPHGDPHAQCRQ